jgi:hypothetical protein
MDKLSINRLSQGVNETDIEYININIRGSQTDPELTINAVYNENRTTPILDNPSQWIAGMVRFVVPAKLIPIFKWGTQRPDPLADENLRVYFKYDGVIVSTPVVFIPQTNDPINNTGRLVWNATDFLIMVNQAIQDAFVLISTSTFFPADIRIPRLVLDSATNLLYLYSDVLMGIESGIQMSFSKLLYAYFPSFPVREDTLSVLNREIYTFQIYNNITNNVTYLSADGYAMQSEFPVLNLWSGVDKILFISNSIPINTEMDGGQLNIQSRVVFDFVIDNDKLNDRTNIVYNSSVNQRWYDLLSSYPMKRTDISVQILFKDGSTQPLRLLSNDFLSLKLQFVRKGSMTNLNA